MTRTSHLDSEFRSFRNKLRVPMEGKRVGLQFGEKEQSERKESSEGTITKREGGEEGQFSSRDEGKGREMIW